MLVMITADYHPLHLNGSIFDHDRCLQTVVGSGHSFTIHNPIFSPQTNKATLQTRAARYIEEIILQLLYIAAVIYLQFSLNDFNPV